MFAEDLGWQFNSFARESWRLVLLFILTELKRGFTHCLKEKAALRHADTGSTNSNANDTSSPALPSSNNVGVVDNCDDVSHDVNDDINEDRNVDSSIRRNSDD